MKRLRWQILIVIIAIVAIALLLSGQQPVQVQVFEPEPVAGGIYTEGLVGSLNRLNPVLDTNNPADRDIDRLLFNSLVRFDDRGLPQAELAESWGISRDATVYNFSLRKDARWHDGKDVTSADVIFTVDLLRDPDLPTPEDIRAMWAEIKVISIDDYTLQFRLPEPFAPFLDYLTFGILPAGHFDGITPAAMVDDPFNLSPIGSGPYQFDSFIIENGKVAGVDLRVNEDYFLDHPFIEQIVFRYYPDDETALAAYQAGEILGISEITTNSLSKALKEENLSLYTGRLPELSMIILNLDNPKTRFFQDANIRRALLMGIHRQWIIDNILEGQALIADGPIFPNTWAFYEGINRIGYDSTRATNIIREAGYTIPSDGGKIRSNDSGPFSFTLIHPEGEPFTSVANRIKENWEVLGVNVDLLAVPYENLINDYLETRDFDAALVDINYTRSPDPDPYPFWHQTQAVNGQNYSMWNDRQSSEYLEQARIIVDPAERTRLYRNFQVLFSQELPALPLFYPVFSFGVDVEVEGIRTGPLIEPNDRFSNIAGWYLYSERVLEGEPSNN